MRNISMNIKSLIISKSRTLGTAIHWTLVPLLSYTNTIVFIENISWTARKFRLLSANAKMIVLTSRVIIGKESIATAGWMTSSLHAIELQCLTMTYARTSIWWWLNATVSVVNFTGIASKGLWRYYTWISDLSCKMGKMFRISTHLNFISRLTKEIFRTSWILILVVSIWLIDTIREFMTRLSFWYTFIAIESLTILAYEWIFPIRRTIEIGSTIEIDVLVVAVLFGVTWICVLIWTCESAIAHANFTIEYIAMLTCKWSLSTIMAGKKVSTRRIQSSILVISLFKILALMWICLVRAWSCRLICANFPMNIKHLTFRTLIKLNRISLWALEIKSTTESWINVKSICTISTKLFKFCWFWAVVERVRHTSTFFWIEDCRRCASMSRRFSIVAFHIWFAVFWALISMNSITKWLALVRLTASFEIWRLDDFTVHTISIITDFSIEEQSTSTIVVASGSSTRAAEISTTLLRDICVNSIGLSFTCRFIADVYWNNKIII